ncbi:MAG TPA: OmpA family protein [Flavobacteriaceae bacterium]|nr:OmpA family protein [Flavobacteriaceae bacterium]
MKQVKLISKSLLVLIIALQFFSFSSTEPIDNSIRIVKKGDGIYMYLSQSINFELNKTNINNNCKKQLFTLIQQLKKNPEVKVEIGVHNDIRTKEDLSQIRANALKSFLENYGVKPDNVIAVGYGVKKLINDCTSKKKQKCTEMKHRANRRVEIKILNPDVLSNTIVVK